MIQLAVNGGHISVPAAEKVRIDAGINGDEQARRSFVISAIKQMLAEGNFRGSSVVSSLPSDKLRLTSLRVPEAEMMQIDQVLRKEVRHRFGLDPERDIINYLVAGNIRQGDEVKNELILFAASNETIKNHIEMLEEAQLRPVAIDTVPCALFRSFERLLRRQEDRARTAVFVDLGSSFTTVVFGCGAEISFVKQVPIGGDRFNREIAAKLGIGVNEAEILRSILRKERTNSAVASHRSAGFEQSQSAISSKLAIDGDLDAGSEPDKSVRLDASTRQVMVDAIRSVSEELAREISLCFRYYTVTFRGKRVERAVFAGGEAYESILLDVLRRQLAVEIEVAEPFKGFDMTSMKFDACKRSCLCEWAVAVGLSLKGWKAVPELEEQEQGGTEEITERREQSENERD
jgi:type IV pilus assembly protein PilM